MTRRETQSNAHWSGVPSLTELWLGALLRLAAMWLVNLAGLLGMRLSRLSGECHTDATPQALPLKDCDPTTKETETAARNSIQSIKALMPSRTRSVRPSKHEGVLTARRDESSLALCQGSRFSRHRDTLDPSRRRAAAADYHEESRTLSRPSRTRISGHSAPT